MIPLVGVSPWLWLVGGIALLILLAQHAPKWAGWLILILVLGALLKSGKMKEGTR